MPADYNLLSTDQLPMKVAPFKPIDAVGNTDAAFSLAGNMVQTRDTIQASNDANADKQVLQTALKQGADFYTPEGLDKSAEILKGKLSPQGYMGFLDHANKTKEALAHLQTTVSKMQGDQLEMLATQEENMMPHVDNLLKLYDTAKDQKGEQFASQLLDQGKGALIQQLSQQRLPNGQPMYSPGTLQAFQQMSPEDLRAKVGASKYRMTLIKEELEKANARKADAVAEAAKNPGNWEQWVGPDKVVYKVNPRANLTLKVGPDGSSDPVASLPPGSTKLGSAQAQSSGGSGSGGDVSLTPEENNYIAEYQTMTGKQVPGIPAGSGAASRVARIAYLKEFVRLGKERGITGEEAGSVALGRDAGKEAYKRLTTQDAAIHAGEKDMMNILQNMKAELKRIGGPDSPVVRKYWNEGVTKIAGDPAFVGLNAQYANFIDVAARVFSNATGAGGTPVSYLELGKKLMDPNINLSQLMALEPRLTGLVDARRNAVEGTKQEILSSFKLPGKKSSEESVPPAVQSARDAEGGKQMALSEYGGDVNKAREDLRKINEEMRKTTNAEAKALQEEHRTRIMSAIDYLEKSSKSSVTTEWKDIAPGVRVRVKPGE